MAAAPAAPLTDSQVDALIAGQAPAAAPSGQAPLTDREVDALIAGERPAAKRPPAARRTGAGPPVLPPVREETSPSLPSLPGGAAPGGSLSFPRHVTAGAAPRAAPATSSQPPASTTAATPWWLPARPGQARARAVNTPLMTAALETHDLAANPFFSDVGPALQEAVPKPQPLLTPGTPEEARYRQVAARKQVKPPTGAGAAAVGPPALQAQRQERVEALIPFVQRIAAPQGLLAQWNQDDERLKADLAANKQAWKNADAFSQSELKQLQRHTQVLQRQLDQHAAQGRSIDEALKRWASVQTGYGERPYHPGFWYPEEHPEWRPPWPDLLPDFLRNHPDLPEWLTLPVGQTRAGQERLAAAVARLQLSGAYPRPVPLPTPLSPQGRRQLIGEKNELLGRVLPYLAAQGPGSVRQASERLLQGPDVLGGRWTPWQRQIYPTVVRQIFAELKAEDDSGASLGPWEDIAFNMALAPAFELAGLPVQALVRTLETRLGVRLAAEVGGSYLEQGVKAAVRAQAVRTLSHAAEGALALTGLATAQSAGMAAVEAPRGQKLAAATAAAGRAVRETPGPAAAWTALFSLLPGLGELYRLRGQVAYTRLDPLMDRALVDLERHSQANRGQGLSRDEANSLRRLMVDLVQAPLRAKRGVLEELRAQVEAVGGKAVAGGAPLHFELRGGGTAGAAAAEPRPVAPTEGPAIQREDGSRVSLRHLQPEDVANLQAEHDAIMANPQATPEQVAHAGRLAQWLALAQTRAATGRLAPELQAAHDKVWQQRGNPARAQAETLSAAAARLQETEPGLARKLAEAARQVREEHQRAFSESAAPPEAPVETPAPSPFVSPYRGLTDAERGHLTAAETRALLVQDVNNSQQVLEPGSRPIFRQGDLPQGVRQRAGRTLPELADRLYAAAQQQLAERFEGAISGERAPVAPAAAPAGTPAVPEAVPPAVEAAPEVPVARPLAPAGGGLVALGGGGAEGPAAVVGEAVPRPKVGQKLRLKGTNRLVEVVGEGKGGSLRLKTADGNEYDATAKTIAEQYEAVGKAKALAAARRQPGHTVREAPADKATSEPKTLPAAATKPSPAKPAAQKPPEQGTLFRGGERQGEKPTVWTEALLEGTPSHVVTPGTHPVPEEGTAFLHAVQPPFDRAWEGVLHALPREWREAIEGTGFLYDPHSQAAGLHLSEPGPEVEGAVLSVSPFPEIGAGVTVEMKRFPAHSGADFHDLGVEPLFVGHEVALSMVHEAAHALVGEEGPQLWDAMDVLLDEMGRGGYHAAVKEIVNAITGPDGQFTEQYRAAREVYRGEARGARGAGPTGGAVEAVGAGLERGAGGPGAVRPVEGAPGEAAGGVFQRTAAGPGQPTPGQPGAGGGAGGLPPGVDVRAEVFGDDERGKSTWEVMHAGLPGPAKAWQRFKDWTTALGHELAYVFPHLGPEFDPLKRKLIEWAKSPEIAQRQVPELLRAMLGNLPRGSPQAELFDIVSVLRDAVKHAGNQELKGEPLSIPEGWTKEKIQGYLTRAEALAAQDPAVTAALDAKRGVRLSVVGPWADQLHRLTGKVPAWVKGKPGAWDIDEDYYHREVFDHWNEERSLGAALDRFQKLRSGADIARKPGIQSLYSGYFAEAEGRWLFDKLRQAKQLEIWNDDIAPHDIMPQLQAQEAIYNNPTLRQLMTHLADPTFQGFTGAVDLGDLGLLAGSGQLPDTFGGRWSDLHEMLQQAWLHDMPLTQEAWSELHDYARWFQSQLPGNRGPLTAANMRPKGYLPFQYEPGNVFYPMLTISQEAFQQAKDAIVGNFIHPNPNPPKEISRRQLRLQRVQGQRKPVAMFPEGITKTLEQMRDQRDQSTMARAFRWTMQNTKVAQMANLFEVGAVFQAKLVTDNLNSLRANVKAYRMLPEAARGLWDLKNGRYNPEVADILDKGARGDLLGMRFDRLDPVGEAALGEFAKHPPTNLQRMWRQVGRILLPRQLLTGLQFLTTYTHYLEYMRQYREDGHFSNYGAYANPQAIRELAKTDVKAAAYALAQSIPGDPDEVSRAVRSFRDIQPGAIVTFIATQMQVERGLLAQVWDVPAARRAAGKGPLFDSVLGGTPFEDAPVIGLAFLKWLAIPAAFSAGVWAWNNWLYGDTEATLPEHERGQLLVSHLNLTHPDANGDSISASHITLMPFLDLFSGIHDTGRYFERVQNGEMSWSDVAKDMTVHFGDRLMMGAGPRAMLDSLRVGYDLRTRAPIRDRAEYIADSFHVGVMYRAAMQIPDRRGWGDLALGMVGLQRNQGRMNNYNEMRVRAVHWLRQQKGQPQEAGAFLPVDNALHYYKVAMMFGSERERLHYLRDFAMAGGTDQQVGKSLARMEPLYGFNDALKEQFLGSLNRADANRMRSAYRYWQQYAAPAVGDDAKTLNQEDELWSYVVQMERLVQSAIPSSTKADPLSTGDRGPTPVQDWLFAHPKEWETVQQQEAEREAAARGLAPAGP